MRIFSCFLILFFVTTLHAKSSNYSRDFWNPQYHGQALDFCKLDQKTCGEQVANDYCQLMGYKSAPKNIIAHNVGVTRYLSSPAKCIGWKCNGFKLIRCASKISHKPAAKYYYRFQEFALPRFNDYRLAWCFKEGSKKCGQRVAYSFCRQMGFMHVTNFKQQKNIPATRNIGDQALCFGKHCNGFASITCKR